MIHSDFKQKIHVVAWLIKYIDFLINYFSLFLLSLFVC